MKEIVRRIAQELGARGLETNDIVLAIGCLETKEHMQIMLREVMKLRTINRSTALALAVLILDGDIQ